MGVARDMTQAQPPHVPVLLDAVIEHAGPISGTWIDATFGAGGYTRRLLAEGAGRVIAVDRDPTAFVLAQSWAADYSDRLVFHAGPFSTLDQAVDQADGVVFDLGVSSMQLDQAERGFSFQKDGPLDMRMGDTGATAADIVNGASEAALADILYHYGEERASRRIARAIVRARDEAPLARTLQLAELISSQLPRPKPGQSHPATRSFQALRIAVNDEYHEVAQGLAAAERVLIPGGRLAVVSFHSVEDRIAKRFIQARLGQAGGSRHAPAQSGPAASFSQTRRKPVAPTELEIAANPRARSALLRVATRTQAPAHPVDLKSLSVPTLPEARR